MLVVTNPNNPTGAVLEVYRGAEVRRGGESHREAGPAAGAAAGGVTSPTFWGRYGRVLVTAGLSKASGMPGLRIGWIVGPPKTVASLRSYHDYTLRGLARVDLTLHELEQRRGLAARPASSLISCAIRRWPAN